MQIAQNKNEEKLKSLKKKLSDYGSVNRPKPVKNEIERQLKEKSICPNRYYDNILNGEGCERLQKGGKAIGNNIREVMKNSTYQRLHLAADIENKIDNYIDSWIELLDLLNKICGTMCKKEDATELEINEFEENLGILGKQWRVFWKYEHITPTFHILESHVLEQLRQYKSLGKHSAAYIERYHFVFNELEKDHLHIKKKAKREQCIQEKFTLSNSPDFLVPIQQMRRRLKRKHKGESDSELKFG